MNNYEKYQKPYVQRRKEAGLCYWVGCKVVTRDEDGNGPGYCPIHAARKAAWQKKRYHDMLEAWKIQVRVTASPKGST
jgi:hypothetical protein